MEKAPENRNHNPTKTWESAVVPEIHQFRQRAQRARECGLLRPGPLTASARAG